MYRNVTSHVDKVCTYGRNTYTEFVVVRCVLSSSKCTKSIFGRGFAPTPLGELTSLLRHLSRLGRVSLIPLPFFGAWNSVPRFCRRFMVTLNDDVDDDDDDDDDDADDDCTCREPSSS